MSYTPTTWATGDTITAQKMNKLENGVANAGGGKYDAYDFVIKQVDNNTATFEKGSFSDIYDALQDMEAVTGVYVKNTTPGSYHDTSCYFVPFSNVYYYSSMDVILCKGSYQYDTTAYCTVALQISENNTIIVATNIVQLD